MSFKSKAAGMFHAVAEFQSKVILTIAYVALTPVALYLRWTDPLRKKSAGVRTRWESNRLEPSGPEWFRRMF